MIVEALNDEHGITACLKSAGTRDEEVVINVTVKDYPNNTCRGFAAHLGNAVRFEVYLTTTYAAAAKDAEKQLNEIYNHYMYQQYAKPFGLIGSYRTIALVEDCTLAASVQTYDIKKIGAVLDLLREMIKKAYDILPH